MIQNLIVRFYILLTIVTPFVFFTKTSEVFELPKIIFVYVCTILIVTLWIVRMLLNKKLFFKRSPLDFPLAVFLFVNLLSTFSSIDVLTSWQGYYSRFYGGMTSLIAMALLYWAAVANLKSKDVKKILNLLVYAGVFLSLWTIMEKLGYSPSCLLINGDLGSNCWAQKINERPFATFGQPNWLAAYLAMIIPLIWQKIKNNKNYLYTAISIIVFTAILLTESRSGILGLAFAFIIYWLHRLINEKEKSIGIFAIQLLAYLILFVLFNPLSSHSPANPDPTVTPSTDIRMLLWQGALDVWEANPLLGTGPETFAYSYYEYRSNAHNLTSEWNFVYNKAHNEYFNYLANTGAIGLVSYVSVILYSIKQLKTKNIPLLAGYVALLISNFFSFTVVATGLLFMLYPAYSVVNNKKIINKSFNLHPKLTLALLITTIFCSLYILSLTFRFVSADISHVTKDYRQVLQSTMMFPNQPEYWGKLGEIYAQNDSDYLADEAFQKALPLAPGNVKLHKNIAQSYLALGEIDNKYYEKALSILKQLEDYAPTDPMIPYFQALAYINLNNLPEARRFLSKTLALRPSYREAQEAFLIIEARN